jgi:hypothetical protein
MDVLRVAGREDEPLEELSRKQGGHIAENPVYKFAVVNNECHYHCLSRDILYLACFYKDVKNEEHSRKLNEELQYKSPEYTYHISLPERCAEWGSFLNLPVTVYTIREEKLL